MMKEAKEYRESVAEIKKAGKMFLGLNPEAMGTLSDGDLINLWRVGQDLDAERCALAAQIFRAEGEIYEDQGDAERAAAGYAKALGLLTETINFLREKIPIELISSLDFLTSRIEIESLPESQRKKLFISYGTIGRYSKAEDLLFEIVGTDRSFIAEGKRFYERLLKCQDKELENGNLPREEVLDSLAELNRMA